jgi:tetratricopeptide (TPR) repeat protein
MAIVYNVTITPAKKENRFRITWHNVENNTEDFFERSDAGITPAEIQELWQKPEKQLKIGQSLFQFVDGDSHYFQQALKEAGHQGESLHLHLRACKETADWPFELLAQEDTFLLPHRLHLVRRVSDWGKTKETPPQNRPLKLLFMACSALDVKPELDFEREEEVIFKITENHAIDMEVEDSGSLEGLRRQLEQTPYDVVHLSGHADIDQNGNPYFVMENESGYRHDVYPDELWDDALIENPPQLLFLSGCRTGETPYTGAAVSFAHKLVEKHNVPAVLGWGRSVTDEQAIHAEKMLYHQLSLGKTILDAIQRARYELEKEDEFRSYPAWPLLRLSSGGMQLGGIVTPGQRQRPHPRRMTHVFLGNSRVQVLAEGFVGRRRQLQKSLHALQQAPRKVGVLILGTGGLGKSCLAGKICERFSDHTLVIVHGKLNAITLESALKDAFIMTQDEKGREILSQKVKMEDKLAILCATSFKKKNYLLLLDDFDQNIEGADKGQPEVLLMETVNLIKALLHYLPISGKMTQLNITCRYEFPLTEQGIDLVTERLEKVWLTGFQEAERQKKARELTHIFDYPDQSLVPQLLSAGHGNPRLMDELNLLVKQLKGAEVPRLMEAIDIKQEDFIREHGIQELLDRGGKDLELFLQWFSIYRRPVGIVGVQLVGEKAGLKGWEELIKKGMGLSLIEHDQSRQTYRSTPLLQEKLLCKLKDTSPCHRAAFEYYIKTCEARELFDPIMVEEWIFHALGCGEERTASEQGGRLVKHLRDRLELQESRRVGEWVLKEKKQELSNACDAYLLNETASTLKSLGEYKLAVKYYEQALAIDRAVCGELHRVSARDLNNLGSAWGSLGDVKKAGKYYKQAHDILRESPGEKKPGMLGTVLNNLGLTRGARGDFQKAIAYYEQALDTWKNVYGEKHPNIAVTLNNLGTAWNGLNNFKKAADFYSQALSIDESVYGKIHIEVASDLNNLGAVYSDMGEPGKAIRYYKEALTAWTKIYNERHPNTAVTLANLGEVYSAQEQKEKAKKCFESAYAIFKDVYGKEHRHTKALAKRLE